MVIEPLGSGFVQVEDRTKATSPPRLPGSDLTGLSWQIHAVRSIPSLGEFDGTIGGHLPTTTHSTDGAQVLLARPETYA